MLVVCAYAQRPDLKAQKEIWRQMVADTAATSSVGKTDGSNSLSSHSLAKSIEPQVIDDFAYGLHQGLNVSLGASAFATFGHDAPHRGGFSQTMNALYLTPLTKDNRLWLGAGGYISHLNWGSDQYADAGLYGILDYRIDPHWKHTSMDSYPLAATIGGTARGVVAMDLVMEMVWAIIILMHLPMIQCAVLWDMECMLPELM